jgi:hypothetical protein
MHGIGLRAIHKRTEHVLSHKVHAPKSPDGVRVGRFSFSFPANRGGIFRISYVLDGYAQGVSFRWSCCYDFLSRTAATYQLRKIG